MDILLHTFLVILISVVVMIITIWVHELGHNKKARQLGYQTKLLIDKRTLNPSVTWWGKEYNEEDTIAILVSGVLLGFVPLFIYGLFMSYVGIAPVLVSFFLYLYGCRSDFEYLESLGYCFWND